MLLDLSLKSWHNKTVELSNNTIKSGLEANCNRMNVSNTCEIESLGDEFVAVESCHRNVLDYKDSITLKVYLHVA